MRKIILFILSFALILGCFFFLRIYSDKNAKNSFHDDLFSIATKYDAISKPFEDILTKYIILTMDLADDGRKIIVNNVPQKDCLNVLILKLDSFKKDTKTKIFGLTLSQFAEIVNWNAVAWPDNLLIFDEKLIAAIAFCAYNDTLEAYQFPSILKNIKPLEAQVAACQGEMLALGNIKEISNDTKIGNLFLDDAKKLALSIDKEISQQEVDEVTPYLADYQEKSSLVEPNPDQQRVMWKILMTISLNNDTDQQSDMIYGAFVFLIAHELGHLTNFSNGYNPSGWQSIDDYIRYLKNINQRAEEEKADRYAKKVFSKYLKKISERQDISKENALIRIAATLSFADYIFNQALLDFFENFRKLTSQQLFYRVMSSDCRKNKLLNELPFWYTQRLMTLSNDRPPIMTVGEVNEFREKYFSKKMFSTHAHHFDRIRSYLSLVKKQNLVLNSWVDQYYSFEKKILYLFSNEIDDFKYMFDLSRYQSTSVSIKECMDAIGLEKVNLEEGGNCPDGKCWVGEFKYFDELSLNGYVEIISKNKNIANVKIVLNPLGSRQNTNKYLILQRIGSVLIELFETNSFIRKISKIKFKEFLEKYEECAWASEIVNKSLVLRSVSENAIAIEAGDIFYDTFSNETELNRSKFDSLNIIGDKEILAIIEEGVQVHKEKGFSGLKSLILECRKGIKDINDFKRCFILQYTGTSLQEAAEAFLGEIDALDIFTDENLINQLNIDYEKLGITESEYLDLLKKWIPIYQWHYREILIKEMNKMRNN